MQKDKQKRGNQPLDVLNRSGQEALFTHVLDSEHAGIAETVIDFGLREGTFNGFFSPGVNASANTGLGKGNDSIQSILPNMSVHHPSGHTLAEAFRSSGTSGAGLAVAEVLAITLTSGGFPVEALVFGADVGIKTWTVSESVLSIVYASVSMSAVANDTLYTMTCCKQCVSRLQCSSFL